MTLPAERSGWRYRCECKRIRRPILSLTAPLPKPLAAAPSPGATAADTRATRARMEKLAWVLDGAIPLPGTRLRFGIEPLIGLVPLAGDVIGLLLGASIIYQGIRIGAPRALVLKMLGNAATDAVLGVIPGVGDLFDFAFKSNHRNAKLLITHLDQLDAAPARVRKGSAVLAVVVAAAFVGAAAALVWWLWSRLLG